LPLGDSITEGFASSGGGYRVSLFKQALANDQPITFVGTQQNGPNMVDGRTFPRSHQGHGGFTIDSGTGHAGISGSITENALDSFHPHIVLLMIGTNDINGNIDVTNAPNRLRALIEDITDRSPDTLVVVASIIPIINAGTNQKVIAYNTSVEAVVSELAASGDHVMFVDNYAAIETSPNWQGALMADYLHPNDAGYAVLGQSFYDAIAPSLR
jgi:lysophospholipase L1-like esterase